MQLEIYTAEVVYNGIGTAQANTGVLIQDNGRGTAQIMNITTLEALAEIAADVDMEFPVIDKGFAISPAPVNAYINMSGYGLEDARSALGHLDAIGTSVVGIVSDSVDVSSFLLEQPLSGIIYCLVEAPNPNDADTAFNKTVEQLRTLKAKETETLKVGLAVASIWALNEALLSKLAQLCKQNKLPMQIAVAKTQAEHDLFLDGTSDLLEQILQDNPNWHSPNMSPIQYLNKLGVLDAQPTLVHMNFVDNEDIRLIQYAGSTVVYCPSDDDHNFDIEAANKQRFPWEQFMKHGAEVAFGTGVQALTTDGLDVRKEVQRALEVQKENMSPLAAVRSAVKGGYRALKMKPPIINKADPADKLYIW